MPPRRGKSEARHFDFVAALRLYETFPEANYEIPGWQFQEDYFQKTFVDIRKRSERRSDNLLWRQLHSPGPVHVVYKFGKQPLDLLCDGAYLAAYCGFPTVDNLNSFADNIVPDICQHALRVADSAYTIDSCKVAGRKVPGDDIPESTHAKAFMEFVAKCNSDIQRAPGSTKSMSRVRPLQIVRRYLQDTKLQDAVDTVGRACGAPTFLATLRSTIRSKDNRSEVDLSAFVLCHAIQILLFSPVDWDGDRVYSSDTSTYTHRFPTPPGSGSSEAVVAGRFSVEDLHRAVCLFFYCLYRRSRRGIVLSTRPMGSNAAPVCYRDTSLTDNETKQDFKATDCAELCSSFLSKYSGISSDNNQPDTPFGFDNDLFGEAILNLDSAQRTTDLTKLKIDDTAWQAILSDPRNVTAQPNINDPDKIYRQTAAFMSILPEYLGVNAALFTQEAKTKTKNIHGGTEEKGLGRQKVEAYSAELILGDKMLVPEDCDINVLHSIGFDPINDGRLYPNTKTQAFKLHQRHDCQLLLTISAKAHGAISATETGLGKTKEFCALPEINTRLIEKQPSIAGISRSYLPSLIICAPSTIVQTYEELKAHFRKYQILVYYRTRDFKAFKYTLGYNPDDFRRLMENLDHSKPETGRTVVLTTYHTLYAREFKKATTPIIVNRVERKRRNGNDTEQQARNVRHKNVVGNISRANEEDDPVAESFSFDDSYNRESAPSSEGTQLSTVSTASREYFDIDLDMQNLSAKQPLAEESAASNGTLVEYKPKGGSWLANVPFQFLIADDAHLARRPTSSWNHMMRHLNWEKLIWVTSTPTISYTDLVSPLLLMWKKHNIAIPASNSNGTGWTQMDFKDLIGLWHKQYNPYKEVNRLGKYITLGMFHKSFKRRYPHDDWTTMEILWAEQGFPVWQVNWMLYLRAGNSENIKWSKDFSREVADKVLDLISICRNKLSPIRLIHDGSIHYPDMERLPRKVFMEELRYSGDVAPHVKRHGYETANEMKASVETQIVADTSTSTVIADSLGVMRSKMDMKRYRLGAIVASGFPLKKLLDNPLQLPPALRTIDHQGVHHLNIKHQDVQRIITTDLQGGLIWLFHRVNLDEDTLAPRIPNSWLHWLCSNSPVIQRVVELCRECTEEGERMLIYADYPFLRLLLHMALHQAGIVTDTLQPVQPNSSKSKTVYKSNKDRHRKILSFNQPESSVQVLIANRATLATGLNIHNYCCRGIIATMHYNAEELIQVMGRLDRLGQANQVVWHILMVADSFHDHQLQHCLERWARTMPTPARLQQLRGMLCEIFVFEIIKCRISMSFNRYAWTDSSGAFMVPGLIEWIREKDLEDMQELLEMSGNEFLEHYQAEILAHIGAAQSRAKGNVEELQRDARITQGVERRDRSAANDEIDDENDDGGDEGDGQSEDEN
ncbi:hypothetical protein S40288_09396 [Stachybotrys chartarum IBT 40288]|nr:hypothetical protein S40288_09396 [Stachybotrys chartarum IBT 40288]